MASATKASGPNWISFRPTTSPTRYFPQLSTILAGGTVTGFGAVGGLVLALLLGSTSRGATGIFFILAFAACGFFVPDMLLTMKIRRRKDDIGAAAKRVAAGGGRVLQGPIELPDDSWIVRCADPQGALFALQGAWDRKRTGRASASEVAWSAKWGGVASQGRVVANGNPG